MLAGFHILSMTVLPIQFPTQMGELTGWGMNNTVFHAGILHITYFLHIVSRSKTKGIVNGQLIWPTFGAKFL